MTTLADLDPVALGLDARRRVLAHLGLLTLKLGGGAMLREPREGDTTDLELTTQALVRYAQTGADGWMGGADERVTADLAADALLSLHTALYICAADVIEPEGDLHRAWSSAGDDDLSLAARAALARVAIARGHGVPRALLASLAGVTGQYLRAQVAEGRLFDTGGEPRPGGGKTERPITAASARAWLAARGVPGFRSE